MSGSRNARRDATASGAAWGPWTRGAAPAHSIGQAAVIAARLGVPVGDVMAEYERAMRDVFWLNRVYQVAVRDHDPGEEWPAMVHLSIKRLDRQRPGQERFRDFQRIKNELVGPECEALELYPAESRLVDSADQFHLFAVKEPGVRFPFGFSSRLVTDLDGVGGITQSAFQADPQRDAVLEEAAALLDKEVARQIAANMVELRHPADGGPERIALNTATAHALRHAAEAVRLLKGPAL